MADELGPIATSVLFENDDVRVWEMDLAQGEVCGMHHHTLDYLLYIIDGSKVGVESPGHRSYESRIRPYRATRIFRRTVCPRVSSTAM